MASLEELLEKRKGEFHKMLAERKKLKRMEEEIKKLKRMEEVMPSARTLRRKCGAKRALTTSLPVRRGRPSSTAVPPPSQTNGQATTARAHMPDAVSFQPVAGTVAPPPGEESTW